MTVIQEVLVQPIWNYVRYFDEGVLTDCEIRVYETEGSDEYESIKAHKAILCNASDFFYNTFTSGMSEAETGIVETTKNPKGLLKSVIRFLYSGELTMGDDDVMPLLFIAKDYGITSLQMLIIDYITGKECANATAILDFVDQCFQYELVDELALLEPIIATHYNLFTIDNLSNLLDVKTYAHVLKSVKKPMLDKVKDIVVFLRDWKCDEEEKQALAEVFDIRDSEESEFIRENARKVREELKANGKDWLPADFYAKL